MQRHNVGILGCGVISRTYLADIKAFYPRLNVLACADVTAELAKKLAERGIRANAISPGPTETKAFTDFVKGDESIRAGILANIPIGHIGQPREIANVALFLASDEATYVTGAEVITDGGFTNR